MEKTLLVNALDHETDLVGMRHDRELLAAAADLCEDIVDAAAGDLGETAPAVRDPILNGVLVPDRTG